MLCNVYKACVMVQLLHCLKKTMLKQGVHGEINNYATNTSHCRKNSLAIKRYWTRIYENCQICWHPWPDSDWHDETITWQAMTNYRRHLRKRRLVNTCPDPVFVANNLHTFCCLQPRRVKEHISCIT